MLLKQITFLASLLAVNTIQAAPAFVNGLTIAGDKLDLSGDTSANNGRIGFFSDIYYDPNRNEWWGLSDRGPGGGTLNYDVRVQRFTLDIDSVSGEISNFDIVQTLKLNKNGSPLNGLAPNPTNTLGNAFDPEGIVVNPRNGNLLISDEYGPSLYEFDRTSGEVVNTYITPPNLIPRNAATGGANYASDDGNTAGKRTNRGFEGLAISPNGQFAYAMLQSAMLDEGGGNGTINRIVKFNTVTGKAVAQYAYQMDTASQGRGVSALIALNHHQFLVLERNNRGIGVGAALNTADKRVYKIDLDGAIDVTHINLGNADPATYTKVSKSPLFLDLDADTLTEFGNKSSEKWEGLAVGPQLADGNYLMLAGTDNDYSVTQNGDGEQFDVYFRFTDPDPYASSIQCQLDTTSGCFWTSNTGTEPVLTEDYRLLPGVLHAYKVPADDLKKYLAP
jgi:hypothetical protein